VAADDHLGIAAVSTPDGSSETQPFFLPGGPVGCLLLHGFTGTPQEMRFLGGRLHAAGSTVNGVRLAGHGTSAADLERNSWRDWYASARDGLAALRPRSRRVTVVGQSMGALLALKVAVDDPDAVASVVALAPALMLANPWLRRLRVAFPVVLPWLPPGRRYVTKGDSDIADVGARAASRNYRRVPLRALHQMLLLQRDVRRLLPRLRQPLLVLHGRQDHTCPLANVTLLERTVRSPLRTRVLDASYHVISVDLEKEQVATEVAAFVAATAGAAAARAPRAPSC
jgi:carboxylesterase